jgi:aminotransferase
MELNTIKSMERIARNDSSVISLGQGIPSLNLDNGLQRAAISAMKGGLADRYSDPQGIVELRQAITEHTQTEGLSYSKDEVLITVGAIEAINIAIVDALTSGRRRVIVPTPTYSAYFSLVTQSGGIVDEVRLDETHDWQLSTEHVEQLISSDTAAILICNPNNPTGTVYDQQILDGLAEIAQRAGIPLIIDEVYRHILFDGDFYSPAEKTTYKDTIIRIMSFSKDFNMTGWRAGYIQAAADTIARLTVVHDNLVNCTPVISQYVALAALGESERIYKTNYDIYSRRRNEMARWLDSMGSGVSYVMPRAGYFFFPHFVAEPHSKEFAHRLAEQGVVTIPGSSFGKGGEGHLRLCFGRSQEAVDAGMQRLVRYYATK